MSSHLDNTHGAAFVGMVVAAVLYGVSCVQALHYYTNQNQNDPWYFKLTVTAVMVFNTIHQSLITHTVYTYAIIDWGDSVQHGHIVWSLVAEMIFIGATAFIVHSFFTMRIWRLSNGNIYLTGISAMLTISGFVGLLVYFSKASQFKNLAELIEIKNLSICVSVLHAAADLLIAATLCTLLNISRTGFPRSDIIINRLIMSTVNTGVLTSFCALGSLITILVARNTYIYIAFSFCLGRLYTNTLLATLNARNAIRDASHAAELADTSDALRQYLPKNGGNQHQTISINIDTTTQKHHDQKLDEENSAISACRCV